MIEWQAWDELGEDLAHKVTAPKFRKPWRPAMLPPQTLADLVRVRDALQSLDRWSRPWR